MRPGIVRSNREYAVARAGVRVTAAGILLAVGNFFASMIPVDLGIAPDLEPMIAMMHAGAAIASAGLLVVCLARPGLVVPALRHPLVLAPLAVAVWSALLAPFQEFPLNALLGSPLMGEGALMYAEVAVIAAAAMILRRFRLGLLVAAAAVAVGAVVPALVVAGWARADLFAEYVCFFALTSTVLVIAAYGRLPTRPVVALALAAGLPALLLSNNRSAWIAAGLGLLVAAFFAWSERRAWPPMRIGRRHAAALLVPLAAILVTAGVAFAGYEGWVQSLTSRLYLDRIAVEALRDRPLSLLLGQGWGRTSEIINIHFNASQAVLWDGSWDATLRRFTHLHNFAFETVLAAGVPALLGILAMIVCVPLFARRGLLPLAAGFAVAFVALWSVWFQVAMTVPAAALAAGWLVRPARPCRPLRRVALVRAAGAGLLAALATASLAAAVWLTANGLAIRQAYFPAGGAPVACEAMPLDLDRGSFTLAQGFSSAYEAVFEAERTHGMADPAAVARLDRMLCAVGRAAAASHSADLLIVPALFRSAIVFEPGLTQSRIRYADTLVTWDRALGRFLARAPRRTDIAWPYLAWLLRDERYGGVWTVSRQILIRDPDDPVGLWAAGLLYARSPQPAERREGIAMLRRALDTGIERFLPVQADLRQEIHEESGKP